MSNHNETSGNINGWFCHVADCCCGRTKKARFADFFALIPPDNATPVAPGTDLSFPQDGPKSGSGISRTGPSTFKLSSIGTYQIMF